MKIEFCTKEESNKKRQEEFLKLSGGERVFRFFKLIQDMKKFPAKQKQQSLSNFVITVNSR